MSENYVVPCSRPVHSTPRDLKSRQRFTTVLTAPDQQPRALRARQLLAQTHNGPQITPGARSFDGQNSLGRHTPTVPYQQPRARRARQLLAQGYLEPPGQTSARHS
jgi:hypothetical protein